MALRKNIPPNETSVLRVSEKIVPQINKYYLKVSKRYRGVRFLLVLVLMAYLFFVVTAFGKYITYDNLQYLLRDLDSMTKQGDGEFSEVRYDKQSEQDFAVFKNGIAAAGKESVLLFDSTGLQLCKDRLNYNDPVLVPSDKYLLLYDMGGKSYSVYNSITRVITRETDHRIADGDMSDSGAFVIVSRSNETKYVVEHYNSALMHTMSIYKDNYVMDTAISKDGRKIVVCSAVPSSTALDCEIALYKAGDKEYNHTVMLNGTMPLSVHFTDEGFAVLSDKGLHLFDEEGTEVFSFIFSGMTLEYADLADSRIVISGSVNSIGSEHRVLVFASDGTLLADDIISERISGLCAPSDSDEDTLAYVLTPDSVLRLRAEKTNSDEAETDLIWESEHTGSEDAVKICAARKGVIVFTAADAYYLFN